MPATPSTPIAPIPWTDAEEIARSPWGVGIDPPGWTAQPLEPVRLKTKGGRCIAVLTLNDGRINGSCIEQCYVGVKLGSSDSRCTNTDSFNHRDTCLWIARDAGNCSSMGNHFYGSRVAIYNEAGEGYESSSDKVEDSFIGALCDAESAFIGTKFKQNLIRDCVLRGGDSLMSACTIKVQRETKEWNTFNVPGLPSFSGKAGIEIVGDDAQILDSPVTLTNWIHPANTPSGKPATGIIVGASNVYIRTKLTDRDGIDGSTGIRIDGVRKGVRIDCSFEGFDLPNEKALVVTDKSNLDATLRITPKKPIEQYVRLAAGWTGSVVLINTANCAMRTLTPGKAA